MRVALGSKVKAHSQPEGVRAALALYSSALETSACDFLLLIRYDLTFHSPIYRWALNPSLLGIASKCEFVAWATFNCSNDVLYFVPRKYIAAFGSAVGVNLDEALLEGDSNASHYERWLHRARGCCFSDNCTMGGWGHGCYNVLGSRIGYKHLNFVFSMPPPVFGKGLGTVLIHKDYELAECNDLPLNRRPEYRKREVCERGLNRSEYLRSVSYQQKKYTGP